MDERIENMQQRLIHVTVAGQRDSIGKRMEEYLAQCEKAMDRGRRDDFRNELITSLDEQAGVR